MGSNVYFWRSISNLPKLFFHDKKLLVNKIFLAKLCIFAGGSIMSLLIGGVIASVLGLVSLIFWWADFMTIIRGAFPISLLLGGALAVYVGIDEIQDKIREERLRNEEKLEKAQAEIEAVKAQAEKYKEELNKLKQTSK